MRLDPRLTDATLLALAGLRVRQRQRQAEAAWPQITEAWCREVLRIAEEMGTLDLIGTETLDWSAAQIAEARQWLAAGS